MKKNNCKCIRESCGWKWKSKIPEKELKAGRLPVACSRCKQYGCVVLIKNSNKRI